MWRILPAIVLLTGCRHTPLAYTLVPKGSDAILLPPGPLRTEVAVRKARATNKSGCDIPGDSIHLRWSGTTARIGVSASEDSDGDRMYSDTVKNLESFREALRREQSNGCLTSNPFLLRTITEKLPFAPRSAYYLRFGAYGQAGFYDLTPEFRLKVVSPLSSGVEVAYYAINASPNDDRVQLKLDSVTATAPGRSTLSFPDGPGYFRILFWTSLSSTDHFATMISATDRMALDAATHRFQTTPSCQGLAAVTCVTIPPDYAVNAELRIQVNGTDRFVPLGGTVRDAVGNRQTFQVRRLFEGHPIPVRFDPARPEIRQFVLMPGDQISW